MLTCIFIWQSVYGRRFVDKMKEMGRERGMKISDPSLVFNARNPAPEGDLPNVKKKFPNVQLIMVVLPRDGDYYGMMWYSSSSQILAWLSLLLQLNEEVLRNCDVLNSDGVNSHQIEPPLGRYNLYHPKKAFVPLFIPRLKFQMCSCTPSHSLIYNINNFMDRAVSWSFPKQIWTFMTITFG